MNSRYGPSMTNQHTLNEKLKKIDPTILDFVDNWCTYSKCFETKKNAKFQFSILTFSEIMLRKVFKKLFKANSHNFGEFLKTCTYLHFGNRLILNIEFGIFLSFNTVLE